MSTTVLSILAGIAGMFGWGLYDFLGGVFAKRIGPFKSLFWSQLAGFTLLSPALRERAEFRLSLSRRHVPAAPDDQPARVGQVEMQRRGQDGMRDRRFAPLPGGEPGEEHGIGHDPGGTARPREKRMKDGIAASSDVDVPTSTFGSVIGGK